jgi:hypothetical protein
MAILRDNANDVSFSLKLRRNGSYVKNSEGATNIEDFVMACTVQEGIDSAGMQADIVLQDSAGLINTLTGSEEWVIRIDTVHGQAVYSMFAYAIESRARSGNAESYIVKCVSFEFLKNEATNLFGSSNNIFDKDASSEKIVKKILKKILETNKKLFIEDSSNKHNFIATNWRALDTIYWLCQRSIRTGSTGNAQNGFLFWENLMGYHFKSIDRMIEDVSGQSYDKDSNPSRGKAKLYRYTYEPKRTDDGATDDLKIEGIVFPNERNYLVGLRNGAWAGHSVGLDPTVVPNSKVSVENRTSDVQYQYSISDTWKKMSHLRGKNPVESFDDGVKAMVLTPRRIRYSFLPNRIFDTGAGDNTQYNEIPEMQAYQHLRVESLKNLQVLVTIPGNVDLYSGYGIDIKIPATKPKNDKLVVDRKYSGRYIIAGIRHKFDGKHLSTEMLLYRDSIPDNTK